MSRGKKALRDSKVTNEFFNQVDTFVCPCCDNRVRKHAIENMKPGGSSDSNPPEVDLGQVMAVPVTSFLKEMLTSENRQKWQSLYDTLDETPDPEAVKQALKLAYDQMNHTPAMADMFPPMDTFDMSNLKEVAKTYDILCKINENDEEHQLAKLAGRIRNLAVTAGDVKQSSDDRLAAKLDVLNLNIQSKITVPLRSCLRQVQLFNMDKKLDFVEEGMRALIYGDKKRRGEDVGGELKLSFRQKLNNPSKLMESASKQSRKRNKKKTSLDDALVKLQRNVQITTEELLLLKKTVSDAEKPSKLPSPPSSFTYEGVPVPEGIPDSINQRFFDAAFAFREVVVLRQEASMQLRRVQCTLATWYNTSQEIWEFGKAHIHEMPRFREYEYTRNSMHAMYRVASRQEVKIFEFYSSEGAPKLPQAMKEAFRLGSLSLEEFEQKWEKRCLELQEEFPSVDQIIFQMGDFLELLAEGRLGLFGGTQ